MAATTGQTMQAGLRVGLPLAQGAILGVTLQIDGLEVSESTQTLHWSGKPANIGFMVHAAQTARVGAHAARAVLSVEGASLGSLYFLVNVAPADRLRDLDPRHREVVGEHRHTQSAFASYATEDRPEMLARVQGMQVVAPDLDIFVDAISLRSGERWQQRIESELRERETLYLFWSAHAANSHWVRFEWQNMLALRGLQAIHPVPLADPREANPPAELASLHFGDAYLGWLLAEKARTLFTNESIECAIIRDATPPIA